MQADVAMNEEVVRSDARPQRGEALRRRESVLTFLVSAALAGAFIAIHRPEWNTDVSEYRAITAGVEPSYGPFGARLLTPTLARWVPVEVVTTVGLAIATTFLLAFLRPVVGSWRWCGIVLFASGTAVIALTEPRRVDGLTLAAVAVAFWCIQGRRWWILTAVMVCGVSNHDLVLVLLPAIVVVGWWRDRDVRAGAPVIAGLVVYGVLHHTSLVWGHPIGSGVRFEPDYFRVMAWQPVAIRSSGSVPVAFLRETLTGLGGAALIAPFGWRFLPPWLRDCAVVLPAGLVLWFIASDWYRTISPAFPLVIAAACLGLRWGVARVRPPAPTGPQEPLI